VGAVLPDLVKVFYLLKAYGNLDLVAFSAPFATPLGALLVAGLASSFFAGEETKRVLSYMTAGVVIHLFWDLTLHPFGGGQLILFPLSFEQYALGLIWPDSLLPLVIIGVPAALLLARNLLESLGPTRSGGGL
jgi:hypothetical protein